MREIKFRGKSIDTNNWLYGSLLQSEIDINEIAVEAFICERFANEAQLTKISIHPKSFGQSTGLADKNGKDIYEGDKLSNHKKEVGIVVWYNSGFHLECNRKNGSVFFIPLDKGFLANKEIIGNIHE